MPELNGLESSQPEPLPQIESCFLGWYPTTLSFCYLLTLTDGIPVPVMIQRTHR